jgi:hypothetical protein
MKGTVIVGFSFQLNTNLHVIFWENLIFFLKTDMKLQNNRLFYCLKNNRLVFFNRKYLVHCYT